MYEDVVLVVLLLYNVVVFLFYTTFCYMGLAFTKLLIFTVWFWPLPNNLCYSFIFIMSATMPSMYLHRMPMPRSFEPPFGMIMSAYCLVGSINSSCMGFSTLRYLVMSISSGWARSAMSRSITRKRRSSGSASTKILRSIRSRSFLSYSAIMPSTMMTSWGSTCTVSS